MQDDDILRAAAWIQAADALLITAGAGMGVDSGLPDFRGTHGFWRAFPSLAHLGKPCAAMATPVLFYRHPRLAWGFYGWRLNTYRRTVPHAGFAILRRWAAEKAHGARVFTSNVDGQFQRAGFADAHVIACHGSIHALQCLRPCHSAVWAADGFQPQVDEATCLLRNAPPRCPRCGGLARPNILMFDDWQWLGQESERRLGALTRDWLPQAGRVVVIELGAGKAVPTVRRFSERVARRLHAPLLRINPDEPQVPQMQHIGLAMGARAALAALDAALNTAPPAPHGG